MTDAPIQRRPTLASIRSSHQELTADDFDHAEGIIEKGLTNFVTVGNAILAIQQCGKAELKRRGYSTFDAYMRGRWNRSRDWGYKMARAAKVAAQLESVDPGLQVTERQARELEPLTESERVEVVQQLGDLRSAK